MRFSSTLTLLTWKSQTRACMIPSPSWLMWKELRKSVGGKKKKRLLFLLISAFFGINVDICGVFFVGFVAVMCGGSVPPPVLSYHSLMVLHFTSDSSVARRGFRAAVTFISHAGVCGPRFVDDSHRLTAATSQQKSLSWILDLSAVAITAVSLANKLAKLTS